MGLNARTSDDPFFFWSDHHCKICGKVVVAKRGDDGAWFYRCKTAKGNSLEDPHEQTWPFTDFTLPCDCKNCMNKTSIK